MVNITIHLPNETTGHDIRIPLNITVAQFVPILCDTYALDGLTQPVIVNQTRGIELYPFDRITADKVASGDTLVLRG